MRWKLEDWYDANGRGKNCMTYSKRWYRSYFLVILFTATAALDLLWLLFKPMNSVPNIESMRMRVAAALLIISAALWLRTVKSFLLSFVGIIWVVIEYVRWWIISFNMVRTSEALEFSKVSHKAYLYNASWWDLWLLALSIAVLVGEIMTLRSSSLEHGHSELTNHS